jgi:hypothetical protein
VAPGRSKRPEFFGRRLWAQFVAQLNGLISWPDFLATFSGRALWFQLCGRIYGIGGYLSVGKNFAAPGHFQ